MTVPPPATAFDVADRETAEKRNAVVNGVLRFADFPTGAVPVMIKDCIDVAGDVTTFGSAIHVEDAPARQDAFTIARLRRAGGGVAGKTHLTEFCFGATGENAHFGNARNPWDKARITGGSSSGSAASVGAGIVRMALGTDTGGSVRVPAALCGVVGLRPSFGRVSNSGCISLSTIVDTIGPMAATARECAWLFDAIAGYDPDDPNSQRGGALASADIDAGVTGLLIGIPRPFYFEDASAEVSETVETALRWLERSGAGLKDCALGDAEERRSQHAIRFVAADVADARRAVLRDHGDRLGAKVRQRIEQGALLSGPDYAASIRALQHFRRMLRTAFESGIDVLATPTTPEVAPLWSDSDDMIATTRRVAAFTYDIGATGFPALSVPCGFTAAGLPVGIQLVAPWGREDILFRVAQVLESHHPLATASLS